jgi:hypothetical protein
MGMRIRWAVALPLRAILALDAVFREPPPPERSYAAIYGAGPNARSLN